VLCRSHWIGLLIGLASSAFPGLCQVAVSVKLDRSEYLAGEPVFVIVEARNVGSEGISHSKCDGHGDLTVPGGQRKQTPNLHGCFSGEEGGGSGCGLYDPPLLSPGKAVFFRYLLKGYRLENGEYDLHASGKAGVRWFFGAGRGRSDVSDRKEGDSVEGAMFDVWLRLIVRKGTEDQLKQRYAPYVDEATNGYGMAEPSRDAREAIAEMAPPFLEKTILSFADQPETSGLAVEGLRQIPTDASRADLVGLFEKSADLKLRSSIVRALAGIATTTELPFLASLLPGHSSALDDAIRISAALGIGGLGGERAVEILRSAPFSPNAEVRGAVVEALGNTRSPAAVPILIGMYSDDLVRDRVCGALATLTHYQWCDGSGKTTETQTRWREWWRRHASGLTLYGTDQCAAPGALLPF